MNTPRCWLLSVLLVAAPAAAQDARELEAERAPVAGLAGEHPLSGLMRSLHSTLKPKLAGTHPRVFVTNAGLDALRTRARGSHRALWQRALRQVRAVSVDPPLAPAQTRRAQNEVGIGAAEAAFAYRIEGDRKYLEAARRYLEAATSYPIWGYANNKPDVDLAAGHLLYGMAWAYDLLYAELSEAERARYRDKLATQARKMYAYFKPAPGKTYAYSQNHTFIPIAGLGIAAYVLYDEVDDAPQWAALARAIFERVLDTYTPDGYFYEGFEYWIFSTPWLVHWLDAHAHATGEDLYDRAGFRLAHKYVAHSMLPGSDNVFDFGDAWEGPLTRAKQGADFTRSHPADAFSTNYNLLYRFAARFHDSDAQGVAQALRDAGQHNAEAFWSLLWFDETLRATPLSRQPRWHYFKDHEVVYWRSDWTANATALAFKCGPPEGHHTTALLRQFPDWRLSAGHAHPDANSFIVHAYGSYLTGDSGYAGVPLTAHHNSLLVDGLGQALEGKGHDPWRGVDYARLDRIKLLEVSLSDKGVLVRGDASAAYLPHTGLTRFERRFEYAPRSGITITDTLAADTPRRFTALIHADGTIAADGERRYRIESGEAALSVQVLGPADAALAVEPNALTSAGPPGAVDKGERVVRGERLAITTPASTSAKIVVELRPSPRPGAQ